MTSVGSVEDVEYGGERLILVAASNVFVGLDLAARCLSKIVTQAKVGTTYLTAVASS